MGYFEFIYRNKYGHILYHEVVSNQLADEGEQCMLDTFFRNQNAPVAFELALFNCTPIDTSKVKDLTGEPTTGGYTRQVLNRDTTDWPILEYDQPDPNLPGDWRVVSRAVTFVAQGGDWGPVTYGVLIAKGLDVPTGLTVTPVGTTGTTTWGYRITAVAANGGETLACPEAVTTLGNATLDATNYNALSWNAVPGAVAYRVYRTTAGGTPNTTGLIAEVQDTFYNDQGAAGNGASVPLTDTSGRLIAYAPLAHPRTLYDGETLEVKYFFKLM